MSEPRRLVRALVLLLLFSAANAVMAGSAAFDRSTLGRLSSLNPGEKLAVDAFPAGPTYRASIRFERVQLYSTDARIYVMTAAGRKELPRSNRSFYRGYSEDGATRIALSLNPDSTIAQGTGSGPEGAFVLHADARDRRLLAAQSRESMLPSGFRFNFECGNERLPVDLHASLAQAVSGSGASAAAATAATHVLRLATVAIDTDSLYMSRLFSNNTTAATNWIAGLFNTMNLMYERDLLVRMLIGTTILRTNSGSDPYSSFTPGASTDELDVFANYWKTNENAVTRTFAILLSGQIASDQFGCSSSGIAWINNYCQKGTVQGTHTVGSYSVNQVCTSIAIDPDGSFDAELVGHELGHNFGAFHTHCTDTSNGSSPVGTNTIDTCFTGEAYIINNVMKSCFSGTPTCPAAGAGTIMSYCNLSGCPDGTQNLLQFHPTHVADVLLPAITSTVTNQPGCLNTSDDVFFSGFDGGT